jgi:flagellar basal-body rod modification protein FlgD
MIVNSATNYAFKSDTGVNESFMSKDDFLRLLTTQLRHQDPLSPISDQDFVAQLAQFAALEQSQNTNDQLSQLVLWQRSTGIHAHTISMLGRKVTVFDSELDGYVTGKVEVVILTEDLPQIQVAGKRFAFNQIVEIAE